jgi:hypothetical protein
MFGPPIGDVKLYMVLKNLKVYISLSNTSSVSVQGGSVRQYIGAPMSPSANRHRRPGTVRQ